MEIGKLAHWKLCYYASMLKNIYEIYHYQIMFMSSSEKIELGEVIIVLCLKWFSVNYSEWPVVLLFLTRTKERFRQQFCKASLKEVCKILLEDGFAIHVLQCLATGQESMNLGRRWLCFVDGVYIINILRMWTPVRVTNIEGLKGLSFGCTSTKKC